MYLNGLDELDQKRPMSSVGDIPAIGRLIFTLDSFIEMYQTHKALLRYNDNFNHYVSHSGRKDLQMDEFNQALFSANTRFHMMYEKAKEDKTFKTDMAEEPGGAVPGPEVRRGRPFRPGGKGAAGDLWPQ